MTEMLFWILFCTIGVVVFGVISYLLLMAIGFVVCLFDAVIEWLFDVVWRIRRRKSEKSNAEKIGR